MKKKARYEDVVEKILMKSIQMNMNMKKNKEMIYKTMRKKLEMIILIFQMT
jgi:hypothetical protein